MRQVDPALLVVLGGVSAALHVGKLAPALPVLAQSLGVTLVQAGFLLSLVQFSDRMRDQSAELKRFLLHNLYRHPQVLAMTGQARQVVQELFHAYLEQPHQMPADFACRPDQARAVADYIAGMTDRFAAREHERLTGRRLIA